MRLVAKHAQVGYVLPGQRPGCRNCANRSAYVCAKHDLEIMPGGICPDHEASVRLPQIRSTFLARLRAHA